MTDAKEKAAIDSEGPNLDPEERPRDPEDRPADTDEEARERGLDKTLADSFPTSDPPSTIPDPSGDDVNSNRSNEEAA